MRTSHLAVLSAAILSIGALAVADGHGADEQLAAAVKARQAHMQLYSFNMATLGAMAKAETPYDADVAAAAAGNITALATLSQRAYWLPGSDSDSVEGSRALPAIWAADSDVGTKGGAFVEAATQMQASAGNGLEALRSAMGPLGQGCSGCHKAYRAPKK